jgi:hypothetical protein
MVPSNPPHRGRHRAAVLLAFAACPFPVLAQEHPFPLDASGIDPATGELVLSLRAEALRELGPLSSARLGPVLLPDGSVVDLDVRRVALASDAWNVSIDGVADPRRLAELELSLWEGSIAGEPGSSLYLAFSNCGSRGWLAARDRTFHLLAEPRPDGSWRHAGARWSTDETLRRRGASRGAFCSPTRAAPRVAPLPTGSTAALGQLTLDCKLAIEADYQLYQQFGDANAELSYVVSLLAAISGRYRDQINVVLTFPYLNLWTVPGDPWDAQDNGGDAEDVLDEFRAAWTGNLPGGANLAHLLSGANLGGGIAYRDVLCDADHGFAVSGDLTEDGLTPLPATQGPMNWDFAVIAHETGHNFGARHTHDLCPPLDECAPSSEFGPCQTARVCVSNGTLMSYCHTCSGGMSNVTLFFHTAQLGGMRAAADSSCLVPYCYGNTVYVDHAASGTEDGSLNHPFSTIVEGVVGVCPGGTVAIAGGVYDEPTPWTIARPVVLGANGVVVIR